MAVELKTRIRNLAHGPDAVKPAETAEAAAARADAAEKSLADANSRISQLEARLLLEQESGKRRLAEARTGAEATIAALRADIQHCNGEVSAANAATLAARESGQESERRATEAQGRIVQLESELAVLKDRAARLAALHVPAKPKPKPPVYEMRVTGRDANNNIEFARFEPK